MTNRYEIPAHIEMDERGQLWMVDDYHPLAPSVQPMRLLLWHSCKAPPLSPFRPEARGPAQRDLFA